MPQKLPMILSTDPGGYFLETGINGWFSAVKPIEKTNLIKNPDTVSTTGYIALDTATVSLNDLGLFSPKALVVTCSDVTQTGVAFPNFNVSGVYTFSAYVRSQYGTASMTIGFAGEDVIPYSVGEKWERISFTTTLNSTPLHSPCIFSDRTFYTTGWQLEAGTLSTYISGNLIPEEHDDRNGYFWTGKQNNSSSVRKATVYSGGEIISLQDAGFRVTEIAGLGPIDFTPVLQNKTISTTNIYTCSNPDEREINITGYVYGCNFSELVGRKGFLGDLLINSNHPVRIIFSPLNCDDDNSTCVQFDFIYKTGLGENLNKLFEEEITITGISQAPHITTCLPYSFTSKDPSEYLVSSNGYLLIKDDNTLVIPKISPNAYYVVDVLPTDSTIFAIIKEDVSLRSFITQYNYDTNSWTKIAQLTDSSHTFLCMALINKELFVGGFFAGASLSPMGGTTKTNSNDSFAVFNLNSKVWNPSPWIFDFEDSGSYATIYDIIYAEPEQKIHFIGLIDGVTGNPATLVNHAVYKFGAGGGMISDDSEYGSVLGAPTVGLYIPNSVFIGGTYVNSVVGPNPNTGIVSSPSTANIFSAHYRSSIRGLAFPFLYNSGTYQYGITDLYYYNNYLYLGGTMDMASSHNNNPDSTTIPHTFSASKAYLAGIGWFDENGTSLAASGAPPLKRFMGAIKPVTNQIYTQESTNVTSVAYGVFKTTTLFYDTTPSNDDVNNIYFGVLDGNLIISGIDIAAYGASNNKKTANGFAELRARKGSTPTSAYFFTPSLYSDTQSGRYWELNTLGFKGLFGYVDYGNRQTTLGYNTGINIETDTEHFQNQVEIILTGDLLYELSGISNTTIGREITWEPLTFYDNYIRLRYIDQTIEIITNDGIIRPTTITNTGNPLLTTGNTNIKVLYNFADSNNVTIYARWKELYISYDEALYYS